MYLLTYIVILNMHNSNTYEVSICVCAQLNILLKYIGVLTVAAYVHTYIQHTYSCKYMVVCASCKWTLVIRLQFGNTEIETLISVELAGVGGLA